MRHILIGVGLGDGDGVIVGTGVGLGVMVMLLLTLVRTDLLDGWRGRLPEGTPNYFLINIQEQDVPDLKQFLEQDKGTAVQLYPMIRARLTAINGRAVDPDAYPDGEGRRWARRGYNLTWSDELPAANTVTGGAWWSGAGPHPPQFSLDEEIPAELGVEVGDTLTFLVAGREISGRISNTRRIDWDSFNVNFFVVANPGALEGVPASYITSFYLPDGRRDVLVELVRKFPSVTVFDVDALMTEVRRIMDQVIRTVEFVFVFTLLAGFIVLAAALQTTHDERAYESALLTTLGAGKRQVLASLAAEFTWSHVEPSAGSKSKMAYVGLSRSSTPPPRRCGRASARASTSRRTRCWSPSVYRGSCSPTW